MKRRGFIATLIGSLFLGKAKDVDYNTNITASKEELNTIKSIDWDSSWYKTYLDQHYPKAGWIFPEGHSKDRHPY